MTLDDFKRTIATGTEPPGLAPPLRALWWAGRGDWDRAHQMVSDLDNPTGAWIHAHLHRQEGDLPNARYWYGCAGKPEFTGTIDAEWSAIAGELLESSRTGR